MKFLSSISAAGLAIVSMASAAALPDTTYGKRCTNGPSSRSCWGNYDISTDYYTKWPSTGVTRTVSCIRTFWLFFWFFLARC